MLKINMVIQLLFILCCTNMMAQEVFIVEGDTLELKKEVGGTLSLFWIEENNRYRYFVQKGDNFVELRNRRRDGEKKKEFQLQLEKLTADANISTRDLKYLLYSFKHFANLYNAAVEEEYTYNTSTSNIQQRISLFVGISNNIYTRNPENVIAPVVGLEYELYDPNLAPRHSAFVHFRQSFEQDGYNYKSTQLSINYRFKVLYLSGFDVHIDTELATFYYSEDDIYIRNDQGEIIEVREEEGYDFTTPLSFGIGADLKITEQSFITFSYNDVVAIVLDGNGSFPIDFTIGYKYSL